FGSPRHFSTDLDPVDARVDRFDRERKVLRHLKEIDVLVALRQKRRDDVDEPAERALALGAELQVAQDEAAFRGVDLEIRLSFRSASLAEETTSTLALLGLEADLDQEAVLAARAESRALDVELDLLQDRRQVLKPARLESLESRFLDGSPGHFEGVLSGHRSLVRRNALEREASRQSAGERERHRIRPVP